MPHSYVITDVGSTTTKAILVGRRSGEFRLLGRGESPTTVEKPFEDVTVGILEAVRRLGEAVGEDLTALVTRRGPRPRETYRYLSTSSAGGGLQILVFGLTKDVTADSAQRAALGGGAIILDVMATDDGRQSFAKMDAIRNCRPDMILISGGLDGGNTEFVLEICDMLNAASPKPRFGESFRIPVIYAGNRDASELVKDTLADLFDVRVVDNLRPTFEREVPDPTRNAIRELFMSHVMKHAPGYEKLRSWVDGDILPTPAAVGLIMQSVASRERANILGMDIGGATTDIFSVIDGTFFRSVSANLGMSYSAGNVLIEAGLDSIVRWLPFDASPYRVADRILTKLVNPTTVPQSEMDLQIEQALATEALRLAFRQHRQVAASLPKRASSVATRLFSGEDEVGSGVGRQDAVDISKVDLLVGSGGALSHAPRRNQAALMMLNAFLPEGVSFLFVDSVFMMPHLGVLSQLDPGSALNALQKDCLVPLGPAIALKGIGAGEEPAASVAVVTDGERMSAIVDSGDLRVLPLPPGRFASIEVECFGSASISGSSRLQFRSQGGVVGVIVDARGQPLALPTDAAERSRANAKWARQIGAYGVP